MRQGLARGPPNASSDHYSRTSKTLFYETSFEEALALALDDDAAAKRATLIDEVRLPADARRALEQARAARARLEAESKKAQESTAKAARTLLEGMHLSVRDAGDLIGISPQRVHQLAHEKG